MSNEIMNELISSQMMYYPDLSGDKDRWECRICGLFFSYPQLCLEHINKSHFNDNVEYPSKRLMLIKKVIEISEEKIAQAKLEGKRENCNDFLKWLKDNQKVFDRHGRVVLKFMFENKKKELKRGKNNGI